MRRRWWWLLLGVASCAGAAKQVDTAPTPPTPATAATAAAPTTPPTPTTPAPPSGCIANAADDAPSRLFADAAQLVEEAFQANDEVVSEAGLRRRLEPVPLEDLDRDGTADEAQTIGFGTYGAIQAVYVSNRGCRRFVGVVVAGELGAASSDSRGLRDVEARWSNGCAGNDFDWTRWSYDGTRYQVADHATCSFCDDPGSPSRGAHANRHPVCQQEAALRAQP
ncbi:MAG: hypothetical protein R3B72_08610 [Polyangiaceae bacterium]